MRLARQGSGGGARDGAGAQEVGGTLGDRQDRRLAAGVVAALAGAVREVLAAEEGPAGDLQRAPADRPSTPGRVPPSLRRPGG